MANVLKRRLLWKNNLSNLITKITNILILASALLCISSNVVFAVQVETGKQYPAGTFMEDPSWPLTYIIPQGWNGGKSSQSDNLVILRDQGNTGFVVISPGESTVEEMQKEMAGTMNLSGTVFSPLKKPQVSKVNQSGGMAIQNEYTVIMNKQNLRGYIATLIDSNGVRVSYILVYRGGNVKKLLTAMNALAYSTTLSDPAFNPDAEKQKLAMQSGNTPQSQADNTRRQPATTNGNADRVWSEHLSGKSWYYVKCSSYGGCTRRKIWLCQDNTFWTSSASSFYSQGGGGSLSYNAQNPGNVGNWRAISTNQCDDAGFSIGKLQLKYFDGSNVEMTLSMPNDHAGTFFNGVYYGYKGTAAGCLD